MNESQFFDWLCEKFTGGTPNSRLSNCKRVEQYEGDLDSHFEKDSGHSLVEKLSYSTDDKRNNRKPKHTVPINGDIYNGTATLKQAINLYFEYKSGKISIKSNRHTGPTKRRVRNDWPTWKHPTDDELYEILNNRRLEVGGFSLCGLKVRNTGRLRSRFKARRQNRPKASVQNDAKGTPESSLSSARRL